MVPSRRKNKSSYFLCSLGVGLFNYQGWGWNIKAVGHEAIWRMFKLLLRLCEALCTICRIFGVFLHLPSIIPSSIHSCFLSWSCGIWNLWPLPWNILDILSCNYILFCSLITTLWLLWLFILKKFSRLLCNSIMKTEMNYDSPKKDTEDVTWCLLFSVCLLCVNWWWKRSESFSQ